MRSQQTDTHSSHRALNLSFIKDQTFFVLMGIVIPIRQLEGILLSAFPLSTIIPGVIA
jgi:hypothetical protein